jgi:hypothetical protein
MLGAKGCVGKCATIFDPSGERHVVPQVATMKQAHELLVMFSRRGICEDVPLEQGVAFGPVLGAESEDRNAVVEIGRLHGKPEQQWRTHLDHVRARVADADDNLEVFG